MNTYALIRNGGVENVIRADSDFIESISGDWDFIVEITSLSPMPQIGWSYLDGNFSAPLERATPVATFDFRSTHAVDKSNEDQLISDDQWTPVNAKRILWDYLGEYQLSDSIFPIQQVGVYNFDIQMRVSELVNVSVVELALFKVEDGGDDYWFKFDTAYPSETQTQVDLGTMTQFDFYPGEEYYVAIKLTKRDPGSSCSAKILGSDDFTAWGSSWSAPLVNSYRG